MTPKNLKKYYVLKRDNLYYSTKLNFRTNKEEVYWTPEFFQAKFLDYDFRKMSLLVLIYPSSVIYSFYMSSEEKDQVNDLILS